MNKLELLSIRYDKLTLNELIEGNLIVVFCYSFHFFLKTLII